MSMVILFIYSRTGMSLYAKFLIWSKNSYIYLHPLILKISLPLPLLSLIHQGTNQSVSPTSFEAKLQPKLKCSNNGGMEWRRSLWYDSPTSWLMGLTPVMMAWSRTWLKTSRLLTVPPSPRSPSGQHYTMKSPTVLLAPLPVSAISRLPPQSNTPKSSIPASKVTEILPSVWPWATRVSGYPPNIISGSRAPQLMCLTSKFSSFQGESEFIVVQERNWFI